MQAAEDPVFTETERELEKIATYRGCNSECIADTHLMSCAPLCRVQAASERRISPGWNAALAAEWRTHLASAYPDLSSPGTEPDP